MPDPDPTPTVWYTPNRFMQLPDGSTLVKPLKPVLRATATRTAQWTGISLKNLRILAEIGLIRCARPTPGSSFFYPAEVEAFIQKTEDDPNFWDKVRKDTYLKCSRLRDKRRRGMDDQSS